MRLALEDHPRVSTRLKGAVAVAKEKIRSCKSLISGILKGETQIIVHGICDKAY